MTATPIPDAILAALDLADASWRPHLLRGLEAVARANPGYLPALAIDAYLPTKGRLFAAFAQPWTQPCTNVSLPTAAGGITKG